MTFMSTTRKPRRGEIWLVNFEPSLGAEIRKIRPAVVVSLDNFARLPLRVIVPLTEWKTSYAQYSWFVYVPMSALNGLSKDSGADAFQVKSVSETRFTTVLGNVTASELDDIAQAVTLVVGKP
jgi:mRNA interferase MazF